MSKKKPNADERPKKETNSDEESGDETTPGDEPEKQKKSGNNRKAIGAVIGATVGAGVALFGLPVAIGALEFTGAGKIGLTSLLSSVGAGSAWLFNRKKPPSDKPPSDKPSNKKSPSNKPGMLKIAVANA